MKTLISGIGLAVALSVFGCSATRPENSVGEPLAGEATQADPLIGEWVSNVPDHLLGVTLTFETKGKATVHAADGTVEKLHYTRMPADDYLAQVELAPEVAKRFKVFGHVDEAVFLDPGSEILHTEAWEVAFFDSRGQRFLILPVTEMVKH